LSAGLTHIIENSKNFRDRLDTLDSVENNTQKMSELLAFFIGIIGNLVAAEIYQNAPRLALWMLRRAGQRLPPEQRASAEASWVEEQAKIAGYFEKIVHALGCWRKTLRDEFVRNNIAAGAFERVQAQTILFFSYWPFAIASLSIIVFSISSFFSIWAGAAGLLGQGILSFLVALCISMMLAVLSFAIGGVGKFNVQLDPATGISPFKLALRNATVFILFLIALFASVTLSYAVFYQQVVAGIPRLHAAVENGQMFQGAMTALERGDKLAIVALLFTTFTDSLILMSALLLRSSSKGRRRSGWESM
jgi:hypothetical protein